MNVKRISKRTLAAFLSVLLLLSTLVAGSVATANATATWSKSGSYVYTYIDTTNLTGWSVSKIRMVAVTNDTIFVSAAFSTVSNTNLRYRNVNKDFSSMTWADIQYIFFVDYKDTDSAISFSYGSGEGKNYLSVDAFIEDKTNHYSANYSDGLTISNYNRLLFVSDESGTELRTFNLGGTALDANAVMNLPQTIKIYTDGVESSTGGSISIASGGYYTMSTTSSVSESSSEVLSSGTELSFAAVQSSQATITVTANSGYVFEGIYYGDTKVSDAQNKYRIDKEKTPLIAKFRSLGVVQTVSAVEGGGTVSVSGGGSSGTSIDVPSGTSVTYTAIPAANYEFGGWYTASDFNSGFVSSNDPYTFNATSANTLYAKFTHTVVEEDNPNNIDETTPSTKNTGSRSTKASLSTQAVNYYTNDVKEYIANTDVYGDFQTLAGREDNAGKDSFDSIYTNGDSGYTKTDGKYVEKNSLFTTLHDIMESTHTHGVSYPAYGKNSLAHYWLTTDTSADNVNDGRGVYTFFYENVDCYNHESMQREHIWPKSKASFLMKTGLGGSDLHHLRPAYGKVNNIKSNWGFGSLHDWSSTYYKSGCYNKRTVNYPADRISLWRADVVDSDSKTRTYIDVRDDVRGDVARILLYVYTRWKQPNLYTDIVNDDGTPNTDKLPELDPDDSKDTGERIIQSKEVLLDWMRNDPVSEWEMQRNDYTQKIQGNRNVFIDYPELAWLLFDETVPSGMTTPSGMANSGTDIHAGAVPTFTDGVELDFKGKLSSSNGVAEITAYDLTTKKEVKNGDTVERGDIITYTIKPDESTISKITEFSSDDDTHMGNDYRREILEPNTDTEYSFTRQAGYYNGLPNTTYKKERLKVTLISKVCEVSFKINSVTVGGVSAGGSGSGMVTARITGTNTILENGDTVDNGTSVTFTFTPDYGSQFFSLTNNSGNQTANTSNITGTDSYTYTEVLNSSGSVRKKEFNVKFAQTFNANDKVTTEGSEYDKKQHINNKGMRPDAADEWGDRTDFTENFEICGVQIKHDESNPSNNALRFVSVIDKNILDKAESYGYVIGYTNRSNLDNKTINRYAYSLVKDNDNYGITIDCTGTSNDQFGDYGLSGTTTNYKYITAAVNNIQDGGDVGVNTVIIARPYVVLKPEYRASGGPSVIYGQYVDVSTGENYCSCSGSYTDVLALANAQ